MNRDSERDLLGRSDDYIVLLTKGNNLVKGVAPENGERGSTLGRETEILPIMTCADGSKYIVIDQERLELSELRKRFDPRTRPVPPWVLALCFPQSPE